ncbi:MAG TPA: NADH-quinone oxidoreductase subunit NuoN [Casimicrobiaceae bacterium]|jgi:NADH-quinone oxidoreductase subunit N|nr:NADH-quinone oxidoreductase subunit NuoN [Casimicrobiaceae bacterium]
MTPVSMPLVFNFGVAMPEIVLAGAACLILVGDQFVADRRRQISYWLTQLALLAAGTLSLWLFHDETPLRALGGMFVADQLASVLTIFSCVAVSLMLFYSRSYLVARGLFRGETFVLALTSLLGMLVMIAANSFVTLYLGLELMSLSLYAMVALQRESERAIEAAMKYFVLGALASGLLLYGLSMIYGATGTLDIGGAADAMVHGHPNRTILLFGLVFVISAIAFKLSAVPYHMWVPDVYEGAPTAVTLFIGTAPEFAAFAFAVRLLVGAMSAFVIEWQGMLLVLSLLSMILGNVVAIAQTNIKRMLAYSTIANMGFMLMGLLAANNDGYSAAMFYIVSYVLAALVGFGIVLLLSREGFEADRLDDLKGLNQRSPWYAFMMLLTMFSLAGVPPTVGFYAKFSVIWAAVDIGFVWLAVIAVMTSLVGAFYYLRIVKLMYFDDPVDKEPLQARGDTRLLLSVNGLALLLLGIFPQSLMGLCALALTHSY